MWIKRFTLIALSAVITVLAGCSDSSDNPTEPDEGGGDPAKKWSVENLADNGEYPDLTVGSNGIPQISYLDYTDGFVKHAIRTGSGWTISSIGKVSNANGTIANGGISSIDLDVSNNPHVCYYDYGNVVYKYAKKATGEWTIINLPLPDDPLMSYSSPFIPGEESSIVIDKQNNSAHIAMQMWGGLSGLVIGYWKTGMSEAAIVDAEDGNTGYHNAIALDGNGRAGLSYEARTSGELKFAQWTGADFSKESLAPMSLVYWMEHISAIAYDQNNAPHVVWYSEGKYRYAYKTGTGWSMKELAYQSGYPALSLDLDASGAPHIAIVTVDTGNSGRLKHAYLSNGQWVYENIEDDVARCAISVDSNGKIHIAYELDGGGLKYAVK